MYLRKSFIVIAVLLLVLVLISASTAAPQGHDAATNSTASFEGRYKVLGTNPSGDQYSGTLDIIPHGGVYQFRWNTGTQYEGVGVKNGKFVAVAFANGGDGSGCGVVDYNIMADGTLNGIWGNYGTDGSGTERA